MAKLQHAYDLLPALSALLFVACSSGTPDEPLADPLVCSEHWQVIFSVEQGRILQDAKFLRWHEGRLYFLEQVDGDFRIRSLTANKETSVLLDTGPYDRLGVSNFWIENDNLLYNNAVDLYSQPLAGGEAQVVFHRSSADVDLKHAPYYYAYPWALDQEALYWVGHGYRETSPNDSVGDVNVWRGLRGQNEEQLLAGLGDVFVGDEEMFLRGESLIIRGTNNLWVIPKGGGEARKLPLPDYLGIGFLGISEEGTVLSAASIDPEGRPDHYATSQFSLDGSAPRPFWTLPANSAPLLARADGAGGWYIALWEHGADNAVHTTIWLIDATGHGTRIACDPEVEVLVRDAVVTPEGLYLVSGSVTTYQQIVRISP